MDKRIVPMEGVRNFRDFGGYDSRFGGKVQTGRLFRSGNFSMAAASDFEKLSPLNIRVQADLRRPDERETRVGLWPRDEDKVDVITSDGGRETLPPHHKLLVENEATPEITHAWMRSYYRDVPYKPHHIHHFKTWFQCLSDLGDKQAALVNCAAGKDRTGILCMLTHHVLGVNEDDIYYDYDLTNTAVDTENTLPVAADFFNQQVERDYTPEVYRPFVGVHKDFLIDAYATIDRESGSVDAYLHDTLGVNSEMTKTLRKNFLTK